MSPTIVRACSPISRKASTFNRNTTDSHTAKLWIRIRGGLESPAVRAIVIAKATRHRTGDRPIRSAMIHTPKVVTNSSRLAPSVPRTIGCAVLSSQASAMPSRMPPGAASPRRSAIVPSIPPWLCTWVAALNNSSADASLSRLSPFSTATDRCGMRTLASTAVAAAASGGATIAPSASAA